ncbi:MAG: transaldolase [Candidatus Cloacimonetes bacterium]|jgi:transaldolase|nr:transaldolase [Candidatus Cloacimonadota bacterium]
MKIFIDSADIDEIKEAYKGGIIDGITTNPSLIKKAVDRRPGLNMKEYIEQILLIANGTPVSLEVIGNAYEDIVKEGKILFNMFNPIAGNVIVKVPVNPAITDVPSYDGIAAIKYLTKTGIPINATLVFTPEQALLAAKAGAVFVSPFAGRIDDFIREENKLAYDKTDYYPSDGWDSSNLKLDDNGVVSGIDLVSQCVEIFREHELPSEVLAASLRNPRQVREAALVGADIATLPFSVIKSLLYHFKTKEGMQNFIKDIVPEYTALFKGKVLEI